MPKFYMPRSPRRRATTRATKRQAVQKGHTRTTRVVTRTGYQVAHQGRTSFFRLWTW